MIDNYLPALQAMSDAGIKLQTALYGVMCDIYYPQDVGHYSGEASDVEYSSDPDTSKKLLIPGIYRERRTPMAGMQDMLFQEEFPLFARRDLHLPHLTKIVVKSEVLGSYQFLVEDSDSTTTHSGTIYREYTLIPNMRFLNNDLEMETIEDNLETEYETEINSMPATDDTSVATSDPTTGEAKYKYKKLE